MLAALGCSGRSCDWSVAISAQCSRSKHLLPTSRPPSMSSIKPLRPCLRSGQWPIEISAPDTNGALGFALAILAPSCSFPDVLAVLAIGVHPMNHTPVCLAAFGETAAALWAERLRTPANVFLAAAKRPPASQGRSEPVSPRALYEAAAPTTILRTSGATHGQPASTLAPYATASPHHRLVVCFGHGQRCG